MKLVCTLFAIICCSFVYSQVGIDTVTPQSDLHLSENASDGGSIQIDGGIRLGGDDTTQGNKGLPGQVLMSNGATGNAAWVTLGQTGDYVTDCEVPYEFATINAAIPNGSGRNSVNVTSAQIGTALNSLPDGGIILVRNTTATTYTNTTTHLTVELPIATNHLDKPFVIAFDGPTGANNRIGGLKNLEIIVKATESNSLSYQFDLGSTIPKVFIDDFPADNIIDLSELNNNNSNSQRILIYNSSTIKAVDTKTWAFITPECYVQNPRF